MADDSVDGRVLYVALGAAFVAALVVPPDRIAGRSVLCPFRRLTGLPCPTCGMSRSWVMTANGRLVSAIRYHPFGPPAFALAGLLLARGPDAPMPSLRLSWGHGAGRNLLLAWVAWAVGRMLLDGLRGR